MVHLEASTKILSEKEIHYNWQNNRSQLSVEDMGFQVHMAGITNMAALRAAP